MLAADTGLPTIANAMNLIAAARKLIALTARHAERRHASDPADMGTAFGLDATTVLDAETVAAVSRPEPAMPATRFEHRLHRRSGL